MGATGEAGSFCSDGIDDDGDTVVNDGCPQVGIAPESGPDCANASDDDGDGRPNDGCPPASAGLTWLQRASCEDEVQVARKDGESLTVCHSFDSLLLGGAGFVVISQITSPAPNLNVTPGSITMLVELDFVCNTVGSHRLTLTAVPDSGFGAIYANTSGNELFVKTVPQELDLDFDGVPEPHQVADTLVINCVEPFDFNGTPIAVGGFQTPLGPPAAPGTNAGLLALVAATAAALALGGAAGYTRRRWVRHG